MNFFRNNFSIKKIIKILLIFTVSWVSRIIVNLTLDINVFTDCFHYISILYYLFLSSFICIIKDTFNDISLFKITTFNNSRLNIPNTAYSMVDKNPELNTYPEAYPSNTVSLYNWYMKIHKDKIKESDFKEFIEKYKSSLENTHSREELDYLDKELMKAFKNTKEMYLKKVQDIVPEDILIFYSMHINQKYGSQNISNPSTDYLSIHNHNVKRKK